MRGARAAGRGLGNVLYSREIVREDFVKLVLFQSAANSEILPGLFTDRGVVDISAAVKKGYTPQLTMQGIIDDYDRLKPSLEKLAAEGKAVPAGQVRLKPPLPRPGKILCCIANYWEHAQREARPLNMFMKNPDAVVGPGDTIMLPEYTVPWAFMHEAELALVIKGPAKMVKQKDWKSAVFGYTTLIGWAFYGEQFLEYIFGPRVVMPYRWIYCLLIPLGAISKVDLVWAWGDLMNALQIFPNIIGVLGLSGLVATIARERSTT